jgi:hypothetical protein
MMSPSTREALAALAAFPAVVETNEPGLIRSIRYHVGKGADGRYPVVYWGTLDEQIAEATALNLRAHSSIDHKMIPLYTMAEDCPHLNPEHDERFDLVDDLVDEWMARNCPSLDRNSASTVEWKLYYLNRQRAAVIPIVAEYWAADEWYHENHSSVCLESYMGDCCERCADFDPDFGAEPMACRRQDDAREAQADFWDRFSPEGVESLARYRIHKNGGL